MQGVSPERRTARFRTVAALARPGELLVTVDGALEGTIAERTRGTNGFGYDPICLLPDRGRTCAELSPDEKDAVSHRGQAFRKLKKELPRFINLGADEEHL